MGWKESSFLAADKGIRSLPEILFLVAVARGPILLDRTTALETAGPE
jgi:hypothetical protein